MNDIPNRENFQRLWNFYTEQGYSPEATSGLLAQWYAESRGNPAAYNPDDLGLPSFGGLQWRGDRHNRLRQFAEQRGSTATDLMTQAAYSMYEATQDPYESGQFNRALEQATTPEAAGEAFARHFIRPAAQHIPQRAGYARMFYDAFNNGSAANPNVYERERGSPNRGNNAATTLMRPALDFSMGPVPQDPFASPNSLRYGDEVYENIDPNRSMRFGSGVNDIAASLFQLANFTPQPVPVPQSNQQTTLGQQAQDRFAKTSNVRQREPSSLVEEPAFPDIRNQSPQEFEATLNQLYPAPIGQPTTSETFAQTIYPIAEEVASRRNLPVEDAPTTPSQIAEAYQDAGPADDDNSEEANRRRNRRLLAADMLEVLSVGLGQMAVGQAVNVGPQLQGQRDRRMAIEEQEQQRQQMLAQQQAVAQELQAMGMGSMARLAMSGPAGLETAMRALGEVTTRRATATGGGAVSATEMFNRMSPEQRAELLIAQGIDPDTASAIAPFADFTAQAYEQAVMPDMAAAEAARARSQEETFGMSEAESLFGLAYDTGMASDPRVRPALAAVNANPLDQGNRTALRTALQEAGVAVAEGGAPAQPLSDLEARVFGRRLTPEQLELARIDPAYAQTVRESQAAGMVAGEERLGEQLAERAVDTETSMLQADTAVSVGAIQPSLRDFAATNGVSAAIEVQTRMEADLAARETERRIVRQSVEIANAFPVEARALFQNVTTAEELDRAVRLANEQFAPTNQERFLRAVQGDPALLATEIQLRRSEGAGQETPPVIEALIETEIGAYNAARENLNNRQPVVNAMELLINQIADPNFDRTAGGPIQPIMNQLQQYSDQLGLGIDFTGDQNVVLGRLTNALAGEFAQSFRLEGSGATSDLEFSNFMQAMPQGVDPYFIQLGMAQRIVRMHEIAQRENELAADFLRENATNNNMLSSPSAMREYIEDRMADENFDTFPALNLDEEGFQNELARDLRTGNIGPQTIISVTQNGQTRYIMYGDLAREMQR